MRDLAHLTYILVLSIYHDLFTDTQNVEDQQEAQKVLVHALGPATVIGHLQVCDRLTGDIFYTPT